MFRRFVTGIALMTFGASGLLADFTYHEKSTITGGAMMAMLKVMSVFSKKLTEPIETTVSVKGDRMVHRTATHSTVIDLSSQTITSIDTQKKTYSVMTFEEMKRALEQMQQKMKDQKSGTEMNFKVSVDPTGKTRDIDGLTAKEMIVKMIMEGTDQKSGQKGGMTITVDSWVGPAVAGYEEVRKFQVRMAEKLNWAPGGNMFMQRPDVAQGYAEAAKEMSKLDGIPVLQIMSMGAEGQPAAGGDQPTQQPQQQQQQQAAPPTVGGILGSRLGLGRKKQQPAQDTQNAPAGNSNPGSLLEMTMQLNSFSAGPVDESLFAIPAGFKKVEPDLKRGMQ